MPAKSEEEQVIEKQFVSIGKVTRPHGVRGELKVYEGSGSSGAWHGVRFVRIGPDLEAAKPYEVVRVRRAGKFAIVALVGVDDREKAIALREQVVFVDQTLLPEAEEGTYYLSELLGLSVVDTGGRKLGKLLEIFDNGAHEVYVVGENKREILLPVIEGVVISVDLQAGEMIVNPPRGLPGLDD